MNKVTIIDYGIGNILSVKRAFEYFNAEVDFASEPSQLLQSERLVLPGVGAFRDGMQELNQRKLVDAIRQYCSQDRPFLGICLGMQMMLSESEEFGLTKGLDLISGKVARIDDTDAAGAIHKVPHVGWNKLAVPAGRSEKLWAATILDGIDTGSAVYFVHSYTAIPAAASDRLADAYYDGRLISAAIKKGNLYGTQFHPEKSGETGLRIIKNFLML